MDSKIEQRVCIKFCTKLRKSATESLEMFREAFGEHSLNRTTVFKWHSRFKVGRMSDEDDIQGDQAPAKRQKCEKI
jgi:hypothetical protein